MRAASTFDPTRAVPQLRLQVVLETGRASIEPELASVTTPWRMRGGNGLRCVACTTGKRE
jgi:hypothetical protein